jgi:hypothetical protein
MLMARPDLRSMSITTGDPRDTCARSTPSLGDPAQRTASRAAGVRLGFGLVGPLMCLRNACPSTTGRFVSGRPDASPPADQVTPPGGSRLCASPLRGKSGRRSDHVEQEVEYQIHDDQEHDDSADVSHVQDFPPEYHTSRRSAKVCTQTQESGETSGLSTAPLSPDNQRAITGSWAFLQVGHRRSIKYVAFQGPVPPEKSFRGQAATAKKSRWCRRPDSNRGPSV